MIQNIDIQKSLYSLLSPLGWTVTDNRDIETKYPLIQLGYNVVTDDSDKTENRTRHNIRVEPWYIGPDATIINEMNTRIIEEIKNNLTLKDFDIDLLLFNGVTPFKETYENKIIHHAVIEFQLMLSKKCDT